MHSFELLGNEKLCFMAVNWRNGRTNLVPINLEQYNGRIIRFMGFQVLEGWNEILIYANVLFGKNSRNVVIVRINSHTKNEGSFSLTKDLESNILSLSALKEEEGKYIFAGTYSNDGFDLSQGLYFARTSGEKIETMKVL